MFPSAINKLSLTASLALTVGLIGVAASARSAPPAPNGPRPGVPLPNRALHFNQDPFVPGELIVRVAPGANPQAIAAARGMRVKKKLLYTRDTYLFEGVQQDVRRAADVLKATPGVLAASPNGRVYAHALPAVNATDPLQSQQWALRLLNAPSLWSITVGERLQGGAVGADADLSDGDDDTVVVAVLDQAVQTSHPDLADIIAVDSTGNPGFDAVLDQPYDEGAITFTFANTHGTNVSGCVAGVTNNGQGIASLPWEGVKVLPVRVLGDSGGGTFADVTEGINYATQEGVDVINMSLGASAFFNPFDQATADAIALAHSSGIVVVASAGNDRGTFVPGVSPGVNFPASLPECIAVGAVGPSGEIAVYSDAGPELDVVAPGGNMRFSSDPAGVLTTDPFGGFGAPAGFTFTQGTSFSAPYVSSVVATLFTQGARDETLSSTEQVERIRHLLQKTARNPLGTFNNDYGYGIVDASAALREFTQYVDVLTLAPNEVTASFAEPVEAIVVQNELMPNPSGAAGDYIKIPVAFFLDGDPADGVLDGIAGTHTYQSISNPMELEIDGSGQRVIYEPTLETRYGIGNNDLDLQVPNGLDPDETLVRSLTGPRVEWTEARTNNQRVIPARSFRFRVQPRVELPGVRMMSVPYALQGDANTIDFLYGGNLVRLARWLPEQNRYAYWHLDPAQGVQEPEADITTTDANVDEPPIGVGFFARTISTTQVQLLGRSERRPVYRIPLRSGFNMVGNPYPFRVPWSTVSVELNGREVVTLDEAERRGFVRATIWRYVDGHYTSQRLPNGSLEPWEAHWVRATSDNVVLIVPRISAVLPHSAARTAPPEAPLDGWKRGIRLSAGGRLAGEVTVGQACSAHNGFGPEDVEMPPPAGSAADLRIRNRNWGAASGGYAQDIRDKRSGLQQWVLEVETSRPGTPVKLTWDGFPGAVAANLRVDGTARRVDLSRPGSLELKAKSPGVKRVFMTTAAVPGT